MLRLAGEIVDAARFTTLPLARFRIIRPIILSLIICLLGLAYILLLLSSQGALPQAGSSSSSELPAPVKP